MQISVDRDRCMGSGQCVLTVPDVFDQDEEGTVTLKDPEPPATLHPAIRRAVGFCPVSAITAR